MEYRDLSQKEIASLLVYGCTAEDWQRVKVAQKFKPKFIANVHFSGDIRLGTYEKIIELPGGVKKHSGIYNCSLHNCTVGNDAYIDKIHNYIANYDIGNDAYIENTNRILVDDYSSFGNGYRVKVMKETGGREIPIFNKLSAPLAYILTFYRHFPQVISIIESQIYEYVESISSNRGKIGKNVVIMNCGQLMNVMIGDNASIRGASFIKNGSINSNKVAPVTIGSGVKAKNFIISSGSEILDSTLLSGCFVGQGSLMDKHYSAQESLFFSNFQGMHGEAASIFAGPHTVSYHKATLLIAGMFSFLNAGSGSNQSNHMYKLGPIHQGIVERGSKTTSDSYLLWPARIGAFTLVIGRHTSHSDTSDLPFSYLIESATNSVLVPGINLRSVGTIRDAQKWPMRDRRRDDVKLDPINFNLLSPYTIHKMYRGIEVLENLKRSSGETSELYAYQNCTIKNSSLNRGIKVYELGIRKFLGNSLISKIEKTEAKSMSELLSKLKAESDSGSGEWIDLSGLIAPKSEIDNLLDEIKAGKITLHGILDRLIQIHKDYYTLEWRWAQDKLEDYWKKPLNLLNKEEIISYIELWKDAVVTLDRMLYEDAKKEFNLTSMTGFGLDGSHADKCKDFENVSGSFEENDFVKEVLNHIERKSLLAERTIEYINNLPE